MKISNQKLYEKVADVIILDIREKRLTTGDRLPSIKALSESFGVGQATIREALNALRAMGYVDIKHGQGTFITNQESTQFNLEAINGDVQDVRNLLEVRNIVEVGVARLAAKNRTDEDLQEIESALNDMKLAIDKRNLGEASDLKFHLAIADASKNDMLKQLLLNVSDIMQHTMKETRRIYLYTQSKSIEKLYHEHIDIFEAIRSKDSELAQEKMIFHLKEVEQVVLNNIKTT
ncbi:FadR/GntR family transcriptional regulator [Mammaliicoccus stepanovicii]|uniref:GntR family transcriptional regulator n=1 Tax=Mammaliicoccus stepanovicii TaxID=643214 RepID=A0A239YLC9_9STAP|nr:FadR/GntR family transcriptional regulator [Mammaliicoccus stepanovicii]PNZ75568.1 FadR family transcriptional regulator [Mammaliicoccus stepanovicii]GGI41123.1 HTH-type transcriptional regulator LutR [Mammaliicoccus stepanovicii]SNV59795.1 GntR family transcriptional regulator [Mammaliicoccus stepanovicii]